jgi:excisionase family DNA binding protein
MEQGTRWLTIREGAAYARISKSGLYVLVSRGEVRIHKLGGRSLVDRHELDRLIETGTAPAGRGDAAVTP